MGQMEIFQEEIDEVREDLFRKIDDLVLNPTFEELAGVLNALSRKQKRLLRTLEGLIKQGSSRDDLWKLAAATYNLDPFLLNFLLWRLRGLSISETEMKHKDVPLYIDLDFACKLIVYHIVLCRFRCDEILVRPYPYLFGSARSVLDDFFRFSNLLIEGMNIYTALFDFLPLFYEFEDKLVKMRERQKNTIKEYLAKAKNISCSYTVYLIGPAIYREKMYSGISFSEGIAENDPRGYRDAERHLDSILEFLTSTKTDDKEDVVTLSERRFSLPYILNRIMTENFQKSKGGGYTSIASPALGTRPSLIDFPTEPDWLTNEPPSPSEVTEYRLDSLSFIKKKLSGLTVQEIAQKITESYHVRGLKTYIYRCRLAYNEGLENAVLREISEEIKTSLDTTKEVFDKILEVLGKHGIWSRIAAVLALYLAHGYAKTHGLELGEALDQIMSIIIDIIVLLFPTGEK